MSVRITIRVHGVDDQCRVIATITGRGWVRVTAPVDAGLSTRRIVVALGSQVRGFGLAADVSPAAIEEALRAARLDARGAAKS